MAGHVRELENAIERAIAVTDGPRIDLEALPVEVAATLRPHITWGTESLLTYREVVDLARDRASREYLIALMRELGGNVTECARRAGMERESLHRLLKALRRPLGGLQAERLFFDANHLELGRLGARVGPRKFMTVLRPAALAIRAAQETATIASSAAVRAP